MVYLIFAKYLSCLHNDTFMSTLWHLNLPSVVHQYPQHMGYNRGWVALAYAQLSFVEVYIWIENGSCSDQLGVTIQKHLTNQQAVFKTSWPIKMYPGNRGCKIKVKTVWSQSQVWTQCKTHTACRPKWSYKDVFKNNVLTRMAVTRLWE